MTACCTAEKYKYLFWITKCVAERMMYSGAAILSDKT